MGEVVTFKQRVSQLTEALDARKNEFAKAIPRGGFTPERLVKSVVSAFLRDPKILECTEKSIFTAAMTAAELGLDCSGNTGTAYLVPYKNNKRNTTECQLITGYRGLIELARRSGATSTIEAHAVYANEDFDVRLGTERRIHHVPSFKDRGALVAVYAVATMKDGGYQFDVMSKDDVDAIRAKSKMGKYGAWNDHYSEMAKKTVIRRLTKFLPQTPELIRAMELDVEAESDETIRDLGDAVEAPQINPATQGDKIKNKLGIGDARREPDDHEMSGVANGAAFDDDDIPF